MKLLFRFQVEIKAAVPRFIPRWGIRLGMIATISLIALAPRGRAQGTLQYYTPEREYSEMSLPIGGMALVRFDVGQPIELLGVEIHFLSTAEVVGEAELAIFDSDVGAEFPYRQRLLMNRATLRIPGGVDSLFHYDIDPPLLIKQAGAFFIGVVKKSDGVGIRMDLKSQRWVCTDTLSDSLFTNAFAFSERNGNLTFGSRFRSGEPIQNWYIRVRTRTYSSPSELRFVDRTREAFGGTVPATRSMSWMDFDKDGDEDLLTERTLFRNLGNGTFVNCSDEVGLNDEAESRLFIDVNNDGTVDILEFPSMRVLINEEGTFHESEMHHEQSIHDVISSAVADWNNDSFLDLCILHRIGSVKKLSWFTNRGGYFETTTLPVKNWNVQQGDATSMTCLLWFDFDSDGDQDLFIGRDGFAANSLLLNNGRGFFEDVARERRLAGGVKPDYPGMHGNTIGCAVSDINNDGALDLALAECTEPYRLAYSDVSAAYFFKSETALFQRAPSGFDIPYISTPSCVSIVDANNDGLDDLFFGAASSCKNSSIMLQQENGGFAFACMEFLPAVQKSLAGLFVDFDNDGDLDLAVRTEKGLLLYRNELASRAHWIALDCIDSVTNNRVSGATVVVHSHGKMFARCILSSDGGSSQPSQRIQIGLGSLSAVDSVVVRWPGNILETFRNLPIDRTVVLRRGKSSSRKTIVVQETEPGIEPVTQISREGEMNFMFHLKQAARVRLAVYDTEGALKITLLDESRSRGLNFVRWNGTDSKGERLPPGLYHYILSADNVVLTSDSITIP